jgi:hypothetical protein
MLAAPHDVRDVDRKCTSALNLTVMNETFDKWERTLKTGNNGKPFPPQRVYNMDEFGVQPVWNKIKAIEDDLLLEVAPERAKAVAAQV